MCVCVPVDGSQSAMHSVDPRVQPNGGWGGQASGGYQHKIRYVEMRATKREIVCIDS